MYNQFKMKTTIKQIWYGLVVVSYAAVSTLLGMFHRSVLRRTVLRRTVLRRTVLRRSVLRRTVLRRTVLRRTVLYPKMCIHIQKTTCCK